MVITAAHIVLGGCIGITFLGMFTMLGVYLYWGYTRMDEMLGHVRNCQMITGNRFYLSMGPWGRMMMVGVVAGYLACPGFFIRRGLLDADEINNFPQPLKRRLIISHYIMGGLLLSLLMESAAVTLIRHWPVI
ncbi:hypothetical protein [Pseudomonas sp. MRSN 12121]|uniref:hypothetical protein n=1 Tax=Pseudomonas sp. MRSN 12121 TaxID=1611770 RepID=UPI0005BEB957|nr:hypothetical protein [Pseudomonas sp. MRSN 12121]AJO79679.1 hypothetical protein TO66_21300 [Pseudomonas sp. MRSN 12121]